MNSVVAAVLVAQLSSPSYKTREGAEAALCKIAPTAYNQLLIAENKGDNEQRCRAKRVLDKWCSANAEALAQQHATENLPWLWTEEYEYASTDPRLVKARDILGNRHYGPWLEWRLATKFYLEEMYARRASNEEISEALRVMNVREEEWCETHNWKVEKR